MKIFHISDLHIGLKLMNRDLREDQMHILSQVIQAAVSEKPDVLVIAGDIYDKAVPSAEAVEIFDTWITDFRSALPDTVIMMISGNHDSAQRVNLFRNILSKQNVHMIGLPPQNADDHIEKITMSDEWGNINFYLLPFVRPSMVRRLLCPEENAPALSYDEAVHALIEREHIDESIRNVLVSHQFYLPSGTAADQVERMDSEVKTVGNIDAVDASALEPFDYAALGHIHKPMTVGKQCFRYSGTPIATSVSEAGQHKAILMVELREKGNMQITPIPLTPLRQVRVIRGNLWEVLPQACEDYVTVILTDRVDLDIADMQDRLRNAFPYLLEIRRETVFHIEEDIDLMPTREMNPFELCSAFLREMDETDEKLLSDIINTVEEVQAK